MTNKQSSISAGARKKDKGICPECGDTTVHGYRPFCSKRCADVDLSRWLRGAYAIAGGNADADEDGDEADAIELARNAASHTPSGDDDLDDNGGGAGGNLH